MQEVAPQMVKPTGSYLSEFRFYWRPLLAAMLGYSAGYNLMNYLASIFTPYLLAEFGWSKSQFSLVGTVGIFTVICGPISGRVVDLIGVRTWAGIGIVAAPLIYVSYSLIGGDFRVFMLISVAQVILLGMMTTSVCYSRLIAENFSLGRGTALAFMASAPALAGALGAPLLTEYIDAQGWRAGYRAVATVSAIAGGIAFFLIPERKTVTGGRKKPKRNARAEYREILASPIFWLVVAGMFFCNLTVLTNVTQLKLILMDRAMPSDTASWMISIFAISVVGGRLIVGLALDRLPVHLTMASAMGLPAIGLFILAAGTESTPMLALAVSILGLSTGADGDVMAFVVMRFFPVEVYGSTLGLVGASVALSGAVGAALLSWTLHVTQVFDTFLYITGFSAIVGGLLFLPLRDGAFGTARLLVRHEPAVH
ncbi:MAG: MFS transporter [Novosphingobium sp.]